MKTATARRNAAEHRGALLRGHLVDARGEAVKVREELATAAEALARASDLLEER